MPYYGLYIPTKAAAATVGTVNVSGSGITATTTTTATITSVLAGTVSSVSGIVAGGVNDVAEQNAVESAYVFREKSEALEVLKLHKDARLREFNSEDDANKYAQTGYEIVQTKYADVKTPTANLEKAAFRGPTKQELIEFRKVIEAGDLERVKAIIWDNPRYLVSSGDTPTSLKEGYRYNAMHVCSISKKPHIAELILQTVSDPKFVDLLTGKKNDQKMCKELCLNLLDYYLNIPEKGRSETPLHFAAKNGCLEMIEVLTSYPECKMTRNNDGLYPKDIICSRIPQASPELYKKIECMLEERFYVPVYCSMDGAIPPKIGEPFSANNPPLLNSDRLNAEVKIQALAGPMKEEQAKQFRRRWKTPPRIGSNAGSPIANNPFISPMKSRNNNSSSGLIATPTRTTHNNSNNIDSPYPTAALQQRRLLFNSTPQRSPLNGAAATNINVVNSKECDNKDDDINNGEKNVIVNVDKQNGNDQQCSTDLTSTIETFQVETNNNSSSTNEEQQIQLQSQISTPSVLLHAKTREVSMLKTALCPKTPLLKLKKDIFYTYREQTFAASPIAFADDGAGSSDSNTSRDLCDTPGFKERHIKITDTEKGLEVIGRELAKEQNIGWREYWDFLNVFIDISSNEGLQKLEIYFAQRAKLAEMSKKTAQAMANTAVILDNVCNALDKFSFVKELSNSGSNGGDSQQGRNGFNSDRYGTMTGPTTTAAPQTTTPYTCVEKSLQVFAKRMTKSIIHNIDNVVSINDTLLSELKRLKSLICSFKEDTRFLDVTFAKVHSRIGNLISIYLENSQEVTNVVKSKIQNIIQSLLCTPGDRREHIECVCTRILYMMENATEQILPQNLKTEVMCSKIWLQEKECECQWETNLSRKTSRRNRMEARYKVHQAKQQEKSNKRQTSSFESGSTDEWRNPSSGNDSSDDMEDDVFWSDFGDSDTEEDEEVWQTPPESPSRISLMKDAQDDAYKIYVCGNEPTKRDLDVLNAIFHIDFDKNKYPNIHSWKTALLCYPNEEMDYFPSPAVIKKSQSFTVPNSAKTLGSQTPLQKSATLTATPKSLSRLSENKVHQHPLQKTQLPAAKRLFPSPSRPTIPPATPTKPHATLLTNQTYSTPFTKLRGLFSSYRERLDSSPISTSSASPAAFSSDHSGTDGSNNLSLLNISATE